MFETLWYGKDEAQRIVYVLLFLYAILRGDRPEQVLAGLVLGGAVVDDLYHYFVNGSVRWRQAEVGHVVLDAFMLFAVCRVAVEANRFYPLWIGAAQIIAVLAHVYRIGLERIDLIAYNIMSMLPSYIQIVALMAGLAGHRSRVRRLGNYPSWRSSFALPPGLAPRRLRSA